MIPLNDDPIIALQREENERHQIQATQLARLTDFRKRVAGLEALSRQPDIKLFVELIKQQRGRQVEQLLSTREHADFNRGAIAAYDGVLKILQDTENSLKSLDNQIATLKTQIGPSRALDQLSQTPEE